MQVAGCRAFASFTTVYGNLPPVNNMDFSVSQLVALEEHPPLTCTCTDYICTYVHMYVL